MAIISQYNFFFKLKNPVVISCMNRLNDCWLHKLQIIFSKDSTWLSPAWYRCHKSVQQKTAEMLLEKKKKR